MLISVCKYVNVFFSNLCPFVQAQRLLNPSPLPYALSVFEAGQLAVRRNLLSTIQASWYCWPLVNFLNFRFIPPQYRYNIFHGALF